uniref:Mitochondrial peptide methionine sulfoxide reductase n=1 Tax=Capra hircus TaxID=9925 RepID=A0A8C2NNC0_CAPHI
MLSATRTARQLFHRLFPIPRMGDSASKIVSPQEALPGRKEPIVVAAKHHVNGNRTVEPFPEGTQMALFGMGCFWGAERKFWTLKGVYSTQVGYAGGYTPNPTYKEVCSGKTGHAEVVRVVYQPERISFEELLKVFWENHDPTQGMRQGNDHGSQYRSAIYPTSAEHMGAALRSQEDYQKADGHFEVIESYRCGKQQQGEVAVQVRGFIIFVNDYLLHLLSLQAGVIECSGSHDHSDIFQGHF